MASPRTTSPASELDASTPASTSATPVDSVLDLSTRTAKDLPDTTSIGCPTCEDQCTCGLPESMCRIFIQSLVPFVLGGISSIFAGQILNYAQRTPYYIKVPELLSVTPPLQGLKGNIESILASRLSTLAHLGLLKAGAERGTRVLASLGLAQFQIVVMTIVACLFSLVQTMYKMLAQTSCDFSFHAFLFLSSTALLAITVSSLAMSAIIVGITLLARKYKINPDNVCSPIAASLSDLLAIGALLLTGRCLHALIVSGTDTGWFGGLIAAVVVAAIPLWIYFFRQQPDTLAASKSGWLSLVLSCFFSSISGFILSKAVASYPDFSIFSPIMNGVAGNRTSMLASRISTELHMSTPKGVLPGARRLSSYLDPVRAFDARAARLLLLTAPPFQLVFIGIALFIANESEAGGIPYSPAFFAAYIGGAMLHMILLFYVCQFAVHALWAYGIDPDFHAIPLLAGLGDALGTATLLAVFRILAFGTRLIRMEASPASDLLDPTTSAMCNTTLLRAAHWPIDQ